MIVRKLTAEGVQNGLTEFTSPIIFRGKWRAMIKTFQHLKWKKDTNMYGGYWVDSVGDCYFIFPGRG